MSAYFERQLTEWTLMVPLLTIKYSQMTIKVNKQTLLDSHDRQAREEGNRGVHISARCLANVFYSNLFAHSVGAEFYVGVPIM